MKTATNIQIQNPRYLQVCGGLLVSRVFSRLFGVNMSEPEPIAKIIPEVLEDILQRIEDSEDVNDG